MKNNLLKYFYITAFYVCSTFVMFSQTPVNPDEGDGDVDPTGPAAPIDKYLVLLALVGLIFVFMKFRALQNKKINS